MGQNLLKHDANLDIKDHDSCTPLDQSKSPYEDDLGVRSINWTHNRRVLQAKPKLCHSLEFRGLG